MNHPALTDASCERVDKVNPRQVLDTELHPLTHQYSIFLNRSPNRTDILRAQEMKARKLYDLREKSVKLFEIFAPGAYNRELHSMTSKKPFEKGRTHEIFILRTFSYRLPGQGSPEFDFAIPSQV